MADLQKKAKMNAFTHFQEKAEDIEDKIDSIGSEFSYEMDKQAEKMEELKNEIKHYFSPMTTFHLTNPSDFTSVLKAVEHFFNTSNVKDDHFFHIIKSSCTESNEAPPRIQN